MDNIKKTSLEEAKANFEQIKKFATEAAKKEFESEVNDKIDKILKESLSVEVDDEGNTTVTKDEKVVELTNDGEVEVEDITTHDAEGDETHFDNNDEEEIEIEKNIDEMITLEQTSVSEAAPVAAPEAPSTDVPAVPEATAEIPAEAPTDETAPPVDSDVLELAQLIDKIIDKKVSGEEIGTEQGVDVDYIDDETAAAPTDTAVTPAPAPAPAPAAPVQEDELLEFSLDEINECGMGKGTDEAMFEFEIPEKSKDYIEIEDDPEAMLQALGDISREKKDWKKDLPTFDIPSAKETEVEEELDEMKGQGKILRNASNRLGLEPREGTPNLKESINKQKAQYESKVDELLKENKRLTESNKELGEVIKNYQESFKDLRKQFDEMQTFNAKLAYANKIFASGGLSTTDKTRIAEEFDKTQTVDEAKKLYNKILEENKISVNKGNVSKIKTPATNTVKAKEVVYESSEMKRRKVLAGIEKNEDYI